jgi:hypothetical protein
MKGNREFTVEWEIELQAGNHEEAAKLARRIQIDPISQATVYRVTDGDLFKYVDVSEEEDGNQ